MINLMLFVAIISIQDASVRFVVPTEPQALHMEIKFYTETGQGFEEVQLTILPPEIQTDTTNFTKCMRGSGLGCVPNQINPLVWTCSGVTPVQYADCQKFDLDGDNDVDLVDFELFQDQYIPSSDLDFDPSGERIMVIYLNPMDRRGYDAMPLISTLNDEFTAINLHGWSWHRYPDQFEDPEIQQAIADIKAKGLKLIVGRDLWPRWMSQEERYTWATSRALIFDDLWITEELEAVHREKEKYGAWATYVDMEPYGQTRTTNDGSMVVGEGARHTLKSHNRHGHELEMTIHERRVFADTLKRVKESTGLWWDFVYPSASTASYKYPWACRELGTYACNSKCFYLTDITDHVPMALDSGYPPTVDIWFSAVTNPPKAWGASTTLSPDQFRHIYSQFEQGKVLRPELKGFMLWSSTTEQKAIMEAFQVPSGQ